jgi:hypothetical protein
MTDVFVSYSHPDLDSVETIVRRLSSHGYEVWWDRRLIGGQDYGMAIQSALSASRCAVVAWSRTAQHSLWVRAEANSARETGKLVQLTLDGTTPPLPFSALHALQFAVDDGTPDAPAMRELVVSVQAVSSGSPAHTPALVRERDSKLAGFGRVAAVGGASICLILLASTLAAVGPRALTAQGFGIASFAMFLAAVLAFGHMLVRIILTFLATRRQ